MNKLNQTLSSLKAIKMTCNNNKNTYLRGKSHGLKIAIDYLEKYIKETSEEEKENEADTRVCVI